jgi:hypothetical protein
MPFTIWSQPPVYWPPELNPQPPGSGVNPLPKKRTSSLARAIAGHPVRYDRRGPALTSQQAEQIEIALRKAGVIL